jgi:hypothetical protein
MTKNNSGSKKQRSNNYGTDVYFYDQNTVLVIVKNITFVESIKFLELREDGIRTTNIQNSLNRNVHRPSN